MDRRTNQPKHEIDYNKKDEKMMSLNLKAIKILFYALNARKFNHVSAYNLAKEVWTILQTAHEGTSQVKESKIELLFQEYELFKMK